MHVNDTIHVNMVAFAYQLTQDHFVNAAIWNMKEPTVNGVCKKYFTMYLLIPKKKYTNKLSLWCPLKYGVTLIFCFQHEFLRSFHLSFSLVTLFWPDQMWFFSIFKLYFIVIAGLIAISL